MIKKQDQSSVPKVESRSRANDFRRTGNGHQQPNTSDQNVPIPGRAVTLFLSLIGTAALLFVRWNSFMHQGQWVLILETVVYVTATVLIFKSINKKKWDTHCSWIMGIYIGLPILTHSLWRVFGLGEAFEILMMQICQNVALCCSALGMIPIRKLQQTSVLFSFFLVFFLTALSETTTIFVFAIPYLAVGIWWLTVNHWSRLEVHLPSNVTRNFRVRSLAFAATLLMLLFVASLIGWKHEVVFQTIKGFSPTSGGKRWTDPYARGGVGDGDFFVAAQNTASTVGPVESDLFLESTKPALFDIIQENYDRPLLPKKKSERSFSPDNVKMQHAHEKISQSEKSGRVFRILRGMREERQVVSDNKSDALFFLDGPTPIRLALQYYDQFDGMDWSTSRNVKKTGKRELAGTEIAGKYWVRFKESKQPISRDKEGLSKPTHPYLEGYENHSVKILRLSTNRILAPSSMTGWHFDKCHDTNFFETTSDGAIRFVGRDSIPELAVYHLVSKGVNYKNLERSSRVSLVRGPSPYNLENESLDSRKIKHLANEITKGIQHDWEKVKAVIAFVRENFHLNPRNVCPADESPLNYFLNSKSGPDYMFATTAALMLRSLNMESRLVAGFYVAPEDFDSYSRQSIVRPKNIHFWIEVRVNGTDWITLEPTPGYLPPRSKITLWQRTVVAIDAVWNWASSHKIAVVAAILILVMGWKFREKIEIATRLALWLIGGLRSRRARVMATLRLLRWNVMRVQNNGLNVSVAGLCQVLESEVSKRKDADLLTKQLQYFRRTVDECLYSHQTNHPFDCHHFKACRALAVASCTI